MERVDAGAIETASAATTASYRSFADATRSVLDLLEQQLPDATLFLAHLDRGHNIHRIVDTRGGEPLRPAAPTRRPRCATPSAARWPTDARAAPVQRRLRPPGLRPPRPAEPARPPVSYLGVPLELSDRSRVGSLAALSRDPGPLHATTTSSCSRCSPACSPPSSSARARRATCSGSQRDPARPGPRARRARPRRRARWPAARDARPAVCRAACEVAAAPVAFLLEPSGREFVSTAMVGVDIAPVTIQPRPEAEYGGRAFTSRARPTSSPTPAPTRRSPRRSSRRPARARRCSSPCCATARSPAC